MAARWNRIDGEVRQIKYDSITVLLETNQIIEIDKKSIITGHQLQIGDSLKMEFNGILKRNIEFEEESYFIGMVTGVNFDFAIVKNNTIVPINLINKNIQIGDAIKGKAVKTANKEYPFRALEAELLTLDQKEQLFPAFMGRENVLRDGFDDKNVTTLNEKIISFKCTLENPTQIFELKVVNISVAKAVQLVTIKINTALECLKPVCRILEPNFGNIIMIRPQETMSVLIEARPRELPMVYNEKLILYFENYYQIVPIEVIYGTVMIFAQLQPKNEKKKEIPMEILYDTHVKSDNQTSQVSSDKKGGKVKHFIKKYKPPRDASLLLKIEESKWPEYIASTFPDVLSPITKLNYLKRWQMCIFFARLAETVAFRQNYDQNHVQLKLVPELGMYSLVCPNVSEKRPSVMGGDLAICHLGRTVFKGLIIKILQDEVLIDMGADFKEHSSQYVDVNFSSSSNVFNLQHEVLEKFLPLWTEAVFPKCIHNKQPLIDVDFDENQTLVVSSATGQRPLILNNKLLNISQLSTIRNILRGEKRPSPYIISGPPGTGKTTVIVELIGQLIFNLPETNLIVCAQSNSAANLITLLLLKNELVEPETILRVMGYYNLEQDGVPDAIRRYCGTVNKKANTDGAKKRADGVMENCSLGDLLLKRIIIITCGSVGYFTQMGFPNKHFSHLILDEAGQCLEPETIVPISLINPENGQIIMAGDEKQLGPVVSSESLKYCKYDLSLFERLTQMPLYNREHVNCNHTISNMLIYNYRSVPSILKIYNDLFYNSKLKVMVDGGKNPLLKFVPSVFPNTERPAPHSLFFYDVIGSDRPTIVNSSWANLQEAEIVQYLYRQLLNWGVIEEDIGVISPYKGQKRLLKSLLPSKSLIGSVAEFQGQERKVIILSTVRSNIDLLGNDEKFGLGFVRDPKIVNVAISRAKYLLLIVGNASLLCTNSNWKEVIHYATSHQSYFDLEERVMELLS